MTQVERVVDMLGNLFLKFVNSRSVDYAYDEEGNWVECDVCNQPLVFKDGEYYCAECEEVWSRDKFFNYISADLPGAECYTCDNDYPSCEECPYGYVEDDDDY